MESGAFLRPHIDNSHDAARARYRVLNLLYYVTPNWSPADGGALELWDDGPGGRRRTFHARFNRLVVMATTTSSWHSVSPVRGTGVRRRVSSYYFSKVRPACEPADYFHVTSFRGRPRELVIGTILQLESAARNMIRVFARGGLVRTTHVYQGRGRTDEGEQADSPLS